MALYRKYRSKSLSEIVGQEHITQALASALKSGKISHAYLFTGPRGTGKTSVARILAHELNKLPYDESATHLDIIEIDAASNRRIDEIRELRERVHNAPAAARYKVYIIDEVHMLTKEAFNALLKTLEEPPEHAIFILATTEAHKLPETIVSRTQRFTFRPVELQKVIGHLRIIADKEKITITDEALELIARHGEGSFRDSIGLLDQVRHHAKKVAIETVQESLGVAPEIVIENLLGGISGGDAHTVLEQVQRARQDGYHPPQLAKQLAERLRSQLLDGTIALPTDTATALLRNLLEVNTSYDPGSLLEITLLEATLSHPVSLPETPSPLKTQPKASAEKKEEAAAVSSHADVSTVEPDQPMPPEESAQELPPTKPATKKVVAASGSLDAQSWQDVLQAIKARHNTLYSVVRMAVPAFGDDALVLTFSFPFHQKRLNEARNKQIITDIIQQVTGQNVTITCEVDVNARSVPAAIAQPTSPDPDLESISNIFGGGEVLE